jgi:hypothetical protein
VRTPVLRACYVADTSPSDARSSTARTGNAIARSSHRNLFPVSTKSATCICTLNASHWHNS